RLGARIEQVRDRVLRLDVPALVDTRVEVGIAVAHHEHRWGVEAAHEGSDLVVDRQVERAERAFHSLLAEPSLGGAKERGEYLDVVDRLQHAEEARVVAVRAEMEIVDLGADSPDRLPAAMRDPEPRARVGEKGIASREVQVPLEEQRRSPARIAVVD